MSAHTLSHGVGGVNSQCRVNAHGGARAERMTSRFAGYGLPRSQSDSVALMRLLSATLTATLTSAAAAPLRELRDPSTFAALYYLPPNPEPHMPLLLYLHGAGESGSNVRGLISEGATGTPPVELEHATALPILTRRFIVVAPQTDHGWIASEVGRFLDFVLDSTKSGLPSIDARRCYVTGHSMGGYGALAAATLRTFDENGSSPRFAAVVPVAPAGAPSAEALKGVSVWAFHGRNDVVCPSRVSELLVAELRRQGTNDSDAKITLYEHAPAPKGWPDYDGHGATIPAYATPALYRWLLERSVRAR